MQLPNELTPTQHEAIIACLREFYRHGKAIRLAHERQQKTNHPQSVGEPGADDSLGASHQKILNGEVSDATKLL